MSSSQTTLHNPDPVADGEAGLRLDKWLALRLPSLSRSRIAALIKEGAVTSAERTIDDPSLRVKPGQCFALGVPPERPAEPEAQAMALVVVYEDEDLIVIDKPAGLVVHPAAGNRDQTLVNALLAQCEGSLSGIGGVTRPGIVHRLDKDTSGLLVAAKTDRAHRALAKQFEDRTIDRAYHAVVWGVPLPPVGEIAGNIGRSPVNRKKMAVVKSGGKVALTRYRVLAVYGGSVASLVECRLATGRTHQIRVHMASIGHPLIGDPLYGRARRTGADTLRPLTDFPRQALHAVRLGFLHPGRNEPLGFDSPIPSDIRHILKLLEEL